MIKPRLREVKWLVQIHLAMRKKAGLHQAQLGKARCVCSLVEKTLRRKGKELKQCPHVSRAICIEPSESKRNREHQKQISCQYRKEVKSTVHCSNGIDQLRD